MLELNGEEARGNQVLNYTESPALGLGNLASSARAVRRV